MKYETEIKYLKYVEEVSKEKEYKKTKEIKQEICEEKEATHKIECRCKYGLPCKLIKL